MGFVFWEVLNNCAKKLLKQVHFLFDCFAIGLVVAEFVVVVAELIIRRHHIQMIFLFSILLEVFNELTKIIHIMPDTCRFQIQTEYEVKRLPCIHYVKQDVIFFVLGHILRFQIVVRNGKNEVDVMIIHHAKQFSTRCLTSQYPFKFLNLILFDAQFCRGAILSFIYSHDFENFVYVLFSMHGLVIDGRALMAINKINEVFDENLLLLGKLIDSDLILLVDGKEASLLGVVFDLPGLQVVELL